MKYDSYNHDQPLYLLNLEITKTNKKILVFRVITIILNSDSYLYWDKLHHLSLRQTELYNTFDVVNVVTVPLLVQRGL